MIKTYRGVALLALALVLVVPGSALATPSTTRHHHVVKGLDWLHTRQRSSGGFSYISTASSPYDTPWAMLAIAAGNNGPSHWKKAGKSPINYLQSIDLTSAAGQSDNVPKYYALCILAYKAARRTDLLRSAGSGQIDLVNKLESYATTVTTSGEPDQVYFAPVPGNTLKSTETTGWAILALVAARQSGAMIDDAVTWLEQTAVNVSSNPHDPNNGGFGREPKAESTTSYTGLVLQALDAADVANTDGTVQGGVDFLRGLQRTNGGFVDTPGATIAYVSSPVTSWAIQGLGASGVDSSTWVTTDGHGKRHSPYGYLIDRQVRNGSFYEFAGDKGDTIGATTQSTMALTGKWLPITLADKYDRTAHYNPWFRKGTVKPVNGTKSKVRTVTIQASYRDNPYGTGIKLAAVHVRVDGVSKTKAASVTASHLSLRLTKLKDGKHTVVFSIGDHAGNSARTTRTFTVAVPTPTPRPSPSSTPPGGGNTRPGGGSTGGGTVITPTSRPTTAPSASATPAQTTPPTANIPGATLSPVPTPTPSFPLTPAASPSASVAGVVVGSSSGSGGGGGASAAGVAAVIAALVALACLGAFLVRRHLLDTMSGASRGYILHEGSSAWQRFWKPAGTPPAPPRE